MDTNSLLIDRNQLASDLLFHREREAQLNAEIFNLQAHNRELEAMNRSILNDTDARSAGIL